MAFAVGCPSDDDDDDEANGAGGSGSSAGKGGAPSKAGSGSDDEAGSGAAGGQKYDFGDLATQQNALAAELGCDLQPEFEAKCDQLYAGGKCVHEWEAVVTCAGGLDAKASDFFCEDGKLRPMVALCATEGGAYDACKSK